MTRQNKISAILPPDAKTAVLKAATDIKTKMPFLLTLTPGEIKSLIKLSKGHLPFVDKAYSLVMEHPEILTRVFDIEEFKRDYMLMKDMSGIAAQMAELSQTINDTLTAVESDVMVAALEIYTSAKAAKDHTPGIKAVTDEMGKYFKKSPRKTKKPTA